MRLLGFKKEDVQKLADYLVQRPYAEVQELIEILKKGLAVDVSDPPPLPSIKEKTSP